MHHPGLYSRRCKPLENKFENMLCLSIYDSDPSRKPTGLVGDIDSRSKVVFTGRRNRANNQVTKKTSQHSDILNKGKLKLSRLKISR